MTALIVVIVIVVLLGIYVAAFYNGLVTLKNRVKDQWSQIDVQLKRRADLIPNLVETVKGYATHEKETLDQVMEARNNFSNSKTVEEEIKNSGELTQALGRLIAVAENYPDLKANTNFLQMQNDLRDTEDKIAIARQFYNDTVLTYNNKVETFPSNIIAGMFHFKVEVFFEASEAEKVTPQVKF